MSKRKRAQSDKYKLLVPKIKAKRAPRPHKNPKRVKQK